MSIFFERRFETKINGRKNYLKQKAINNRLMFRQNPQDVDQTRIFFVAFELEKKQNNVCKTQKIQSVS